MNDIDQKIQDALRRTSAPEGLTGEPNLAEEALIAFRGRHQWLSTMALIVSFALFGAAVWAGWRFFGAETVRAQLLWGALAMWAMLSIGFLKIWFWLEMQTNRVLREIKRVELLVVTRPPTT